MHTTSSNIHWPLNLLWKRLKTTTPWSLLPTWRLTSIRSNPLSRSCTTLKCAKLTRWLGKYLCLWIIIEIRLLLFFLANLNFGDFHNSKSWQKIYIERWKYITIFISYFLGLMVKRRLMYVWPQTTMLWMLPAKLESSKLETILTHMLSVFLFTMIPRI